MFHQYTRSLHLVRTHTGVTTADCEKINQKYFHTSPSPTPTSCQTHHTSNHHKSSPVETMENFSLVHLVKYYNNDSMAMLHKLTNIWSVLKFKKLSIHIFILKKSRKRLGQSKNISTEQLYVKFV